MPLGALFPRVLIAHAPTPLEPLERLSRRLSGPDIWIKRDDCTGLAGGGNKARKLEFLIAAALADEADTLITAGAIQSNHARQTAAAAARFNLRCQLVLTDSVPGTPPHYRESGNILLDQILGAEIKLAGGDADSAHAMQDLAQALRCQGRRPFVIPVGGSNALGAFGYVQAFAELHAQAVERSLAVDHIVLATGSGGTQAGLLLGAHLHGWRGSIHGISVGASAQRQRLKVADVMRAAADLLTIETGDAEIRIDDRFVGAGYGQPAEDTIEAIRLTAESEGILLDPVYSGKAMAGLIASIRAGTFRRGEVVVFLHTGGSAALSAYSQHFTSGKETTWSARPTP